MALIVTNTHRIVDSAGRPANGRIYFRQTARIVTDDTVVLTVQGSTAVVSGKFARPLDIPETPAGEGVEIVEDFGQGDKREVLTWWTHIGAAPSYEYKDLPQDSMPAQGGVPSWVSGVYQAAADAEAARDAALEVLDNLPQVITDTTAPLLDELVQERIVELDAGINDGVMTAIGGSPGTAFAQQQNNLYTRVAVPNTFASLGDSIIDMDSYQGDRNYAKGTNLAGGISYGLAKLGSPVRTVYNGGGPGEQSNAWAARIPTLIATGADTVLLGPPTNDLLQNQSISTIRARMTANINALRPYVSRLIVMTALPNQNLNAGQSQVRRLYNTWIAEVARKTPRLTLFDPNRWVENTGSAGNWLAGMSTDNVHPTEAAGLLIGNAFATQMAHMFPKPPPLWTHSSDTTNKLVNGQVGGTSGIKGDASVTGSVCNNWTVEKITGASSAVACSVIVRPDDIPGNVCRMVMSGGPGDYRIRQDVAVTAGEFVFLDMEWMVPTDWTGPHRMQMQIDFLNASSTVISSVPVNYSPGGGSLLTKSPAGSFRFRTPSVEVPALAVTARCFLRYAMTAGTIDFAGAALRNASTTGPV